MHLFLILLQANEAIATRERAARPYSSTTGVDPIGQLIFTVIAVAVLSYIVIGVYMKLKRDKKRE
jgi:hypothetical protein